jgi:hypothetical protein
VFDDDNIGLTIAVGVGGLVILVAVVYMVARLLGARKTVIHHARCPAVGCGQKVRYVPARAGQPVMCPRCKRQFNLPATPQPVQKTKARLVPGTRKAGPSAPRNKDKDAEEET